MQAARLLARLIAYYVVVGLLIAGALWLFPDLQDYLPIGRIHALLAENGGEMRKGLAGIKVAHIDTIGGSLIWLVSAMVGALLTALPVSWTYMAVRDQEQYDQSLIGTIVIMPIIITSIVVIVQDSLALSFSLAGIIGAVRFRNSLKSTGDLLFTLLSIAIGISAGIGAMELAAVTSIMFNLCFVVLWATEYGETKNMKRFLADYRHDEDETEVRTTEVMVAAVTVTETVTEKPTS